MSLCTLNFAKSWLPTNPTMSKCLPSSGWNSVPNCKNERQREVKEQGWRKHLGHTTKGPQTQTTPNGVGNNVLCLCLPLQLQSSQWGDNIRPVIISKPGQLASPRQDWNNGGCQFSFPGKKKVAHYWSGVASSVIQIFILGLLLDPPLYLEFQMAVTARSIFYFLHLHEKALMCHFRFSPGNCHSSFCILRSSLSEDALEHFFAVGMKYGSLVLHIEAERKRLSGLVQSGLFSLVLVLSVKIWNSLILPRFSLSIVKGNWKKAGWRVVNNWGYNLVPPSLSCYLSIWSCPCPKSSAVLFIYLLSVFLFLLLSEYNRSLNVTSYVMYVTMFYGSVLWFLYSLPVAFQALLFF